MENILYKIVIKFFQFLTKIFWMTRFQNFLQKVITKYFMRNKYKTFLQYLAIQCIK